MKTLKMLIAACSCIIVTGASAQNNSPTPNNTPVPQQRTSYIKQHVSDITSDQESKILSIEQSCSTAMQGATNNHAKDSIRRSSDSQMKGVLTPGQYTQYEKIEKNLPKDDTGSY